MLFTPRKSDAATFDATVKPLQVFVSADIMSTLEAASRMRGVCMGSLVRQSLRYAMDSIEPIRC